MNTHKLYHVKLNGQTYHVYGYSRAQVARDLRVCLQSVRQAPWTDRPLEPHISLYYDPRMALDFPGG